MNRGTDLPKRRALSLRDGKCTLVMLMSDKGEVNRPLSTPLFFRSGSSRHLALNIAVYFPLFSVKWGIDC